jgi:hypothetical protein
VQDIERAAERVADDGLAPWAPGKCPVQRQLEPGQALVVDTRVPEDMSADRPLRIHAPLLRVEPETLDRLSLQRVGTLRVGLARHVDEATRLVGQRAVELVRVEP